MSLWHKFVGKWETAVLAHSRTSFFITTSFTAWFGFCGLAAATTRIDGQVQGGGAPIANSTVTLWAASDKAPSQLAQVKTDADGRFQISIDQSPSKDASLYLVATGGEPAANKAGGSNPAIGLITVLGNTPPAKVTINELRPWRRCGPTIRS
jgi:hypothetical protein